MHCNGCDDCGCIGVHDDSGSHSDSRYSRNDDILVGTNDDSYDRSSTSFYPFWIGGLPKLFSLLGAFLQLVSPL